MLNVLILQVYTRGKLPVDGFPHYRSWFVSLIYRSFLKFRQETDAHLAAGTLRLSG